jgi:hypothetical protein
VYPTQVIALQSFDFERTLRLVNFVERQTVSMLSSDLFIHKNVSSENSQQQQYVEKSEFMLDTH